jgi:hypothetical protein
MEPSSDLTDNKEEKKKREIMHSPGGVPGISGLETHTQQVAEDVVCRGI